MTTTAPFPVPYPLIDLAGTDMSYRASAPERHGRLESRPERLSAGHQIVDITGLPWPAARPEDCYLNLTCGVWTIQHVPRARMARRT